MLQQSNCNLFQCGCSVFLQFLRLHFVNFALTIYFKACLYQLRCVREVSVHQLKPIVYNCAELARSPLLCYEHMTSICSTHVLTAYILYVALSLSSLTFYLIIKSG